MLLCLQLPLLCGTVAVWAIIHHSIVLSVAHSTFPRFNFLQSVMFDHVILNLPLFMVPGKVPWIASFSKPLTCLVWCDRNIVASDLMLDAGREFLTLSAWKCLFQCKMPWLVRVKVAQLQHVVSVKDVLLQVYTRASDEMESPATYVTYLQNTYYRTLTVRHRF